MKIVAISVLLLVISSVNVDGLSVETNSDGFTITFANLPLMAHRLMAPLIAVGTSQSNFTEDRGNFLIEDKVVEKIELPAFVTDTTGLPQRFSVVLSNGIFPDITVNLTITETQLEFFSSSIRVEMKVEGRDRLWFRLQSDKDEKIYGGGSQFTYLNMKGHDFPMWTREQGVGRNRSSPLTEIVEVASPGAGGDYHTTYYPIPMFISHRIYAVQSNHKSYSVLNFTDPLINELYAHGDHMELDLTTADTLLELVSGIHRASSRIPPTLPDWIYNGAIISAEGGTQQMLEKVQQCTEAGVNISALWIQDWSGKIQTSFGYRVFWNWKWNQELYPGLDQIIKQLEMQGIQVTAYINPHLNEEGDIFAEADSLGYLLKNKMNQTLRQDFGEFLGGTIDFSNPLAKRWYTELVKTNIIDLGFKGFMADFGEYMPVDVTPFNPNIDPYEFHNQLPVEWASTVRNALEETGTLNQILPWARSGFTGAQQFQSMVWGGDQNVDWTVSDGLPSSIVGALSLGLSGFGLSHSDIGGFTTIDIFVTRSRELLLRWAEYSVFTPLMRTHEGNKPNLNHQIYSTSSTLSAFARLTNMYTRLTPYHKEVVQQVSLSGLPAMRPLFLHHPEDAEAYDIQYEYLYGYDLLVAPVLRPNMNEWTVYLPTDQWIYLWDENDVIVQGPTNITVSAGLGNCPVFYRVGTKWADLFRSIRGM